MQTIWNLTKNVKVCIFNTSTKIKFMCSPKVSNEGACAKSDRIRSFPRPYFPGFGLNTEI